jgi:hypothetical protein
VRWRIGNAHLRRESEFAHESVDRRRISLAPIGHQEGFVSQVPLAGGKRLEHFERRFGRGNDAPLIGRLG